MDIDPTYTGYFGKISQFKFHFADPKAILIKNQDLANDDVEVLGLSVKVIENEFLGIVEMSQADYYETGFAWVTISLDGIQA